MNEKTVQMNKKNMIGSIVIVSVALILICAGCVENKSPASISTNISTQNDYDLEGSTWTLTTFIPGDDIDSYSPLCGTTITASFDDGKISGTAGCNHYSGSYSLVKEIIINEITSTEMACMEPSGIMLQETQYLNILHNITTYTIEKNQLTLSTKDGRALVYLAKSDTTPGSGVILSASEVLEDPIYDLEIKVHGKVSALDEMPCPCFALTSDGKMLTVHYDLMEEDDGTRRPAVSVKGIQNGDQVIVTGELRSSNGTGHGTTFWASSIEKMKTGDILGSLANVNDIEIMLLESFPVQVNVVARGEHLDSCTKVDRITTRREGNIFFITITKSRPANKICAQVITPFREVITLDAAGLKAGVYTVDVNGVRDTFTMPDDSNLTSRP
jgi:inhibitor of cysteine peptidase